MSRFFLSAHANRDLDEIESYLDKLPKGPAARGAEAIVRTLHSIGKEPYLGAPHSTLTRMLGVEVRSRLTHPYRIYYRLGSATPEIIAVLHTARGTQTILAERFQ
jgi:plasmid stabilization system protein ParE